MEDHIHYDREKNKHIIQLKTGTYVDTFAPLMIFQSHAKFDDNCDREEMSGIFENFRSDTIVSHSNASSENIQDYIGIIIVPVDANCDREEMSGILTEFNDNRWKCLFAYISNMFIKLMYVVMHNPFVSLTFSTNMQIKPRSMLLISQWCQSSVRHFVQ